MPLNLSITELEGAGGLTGFFGGGLVSYSLSYYANKMLTKGLIGNMLTNGSIGAVGALTQKAVLIPLLWISIVFDDEQKNKPIDEFTVGFWMTYIPGFAMGQVIETCVSTFFGNQSILGAASTLVLSAGAYIACDKIRESLFPTD